MRFADESLREGLSNAKEVQHNEQLYAEAMACMTAASDEGAYRNAAQKFYSLGSYKDSSSRREQCLQRADRIRADRMQREETKRKEDIYSRAEKCMRLGTVEGCNSAIQLYESVPNFRSSAAQISECRRKIEEIKAKEAARQVAVEKAKKKAKKIAIIAAPIVCVCIAFVIVLTTVIIPKQEYSKKYSEAMELLAKAKPGDTVFFGAYEQDNNTSNGKEDIKWLVLDKKDDAVLVISKHVLEDKSFGRNDDTWETCSLRKWLNGDFINDAFSPEEQSKLQITNVSADKNPKFDVDSGNATMDKVFLLSVAEVEKYFISDESRIADLHSAVSNEYYSDRWWLRTSGVSFDTYGKTYYRYGAVCIGNTGVVSYGGNPADNINGVRPAMWISLE